MSVIEKYKVGTFADVMTTELNSIANNALAVATAAFNNTQGAAGDGYVQCDVQLVVTFGVAPTANTGVSVWFLSAPDGTNYEDGDTNVTPARIPDVVFPVRAVTTLQRINRRIWLPWSNFKALVKNDGTGQAFAATGNILSIRPVTREGV
jgi:hypothetical protein